jgi:hypothetical protein
MDRAARCDRLGSSYLHAVDNFARRKSLPIGTCSTVGSDDRHIVPPVSELGR